MNQTVLALVDGKLVEVVVQSGGGGNVGVAVDGGNATTTYTQPALRIDFGAST